MTRLEYTEFSHKNPLYTPLHEGSLAVVSCDIELYNSINLIAEDQQKVSSEHSQLKIIIPAGTYSINEFNKKIKVSKPMWVSPQIKDYKLVIPEHHTFVASALLFKTLGINANFLTKIKSSLTNGNTRPT